MGAIASLFMYAIVIGVISVVAYFVIKTAVKDALREYNNEKIIKIMLKEKQKQKWEEIKMNGNEKFTLNNKELDFGILDFWKFKYSNIFNLQEVIAEFIVEKALGLDKSYNTDYWTLFDIPYRNYRIEVKETSYYHPWNEDGKISSQRTFGITKANSNYESPDIENKFERQNDIYIFCLNTGTTRESSNPMNLNNWIFYILPTSIINKECGENKTISLNRVKEIAKQVPYERIKETIDSIIDKNNENK